MEVERELRPDDDPHCGNRLRGRGVPGAADRREAGGGMPVLGDGPSGQRPQTQDVVGGDWWPMSPQPGRFAPTMSCYANEELLDAPQKISE